MKTVWHKDVPCSGERYVRLAQRPFAGTKSCVAVLSDVPGWFCVRAEHDASGCEPFWVCLRNADCRALLRALKIPRAFCSQKRSALQSPLQCAAIVHAACCVVTCSVLRGGFRLHPLRRRGCCVQNGNVPDRCPQGAFYPKRSPLPACPMLEAGRGLALRIVCRCLRPWERDALRLPWEACLQAVPWWCGAGGGGSEPYAEGSACDAFQRQRLVEEAVVGGSLL